MRIQKGGFYATRLGYAKEVSNFAIVEDHSDGECANGGYAPDGLCLHRTLAGAERCLAHRSSGGTQCVDVYVYECGRCFRQRPRPRNQGVKMMRANSYAEITGLQTMAIRCAAERVGASQQDMEAYFIAGGEWNASTGLDLENLLVECWLDLTIGLAKRIERLIQGK